ncbi:type II toxin-antitoxin system RelE family toxin [Cupriavidus malaysiensis]|uniref:Addiction module toxin RelE n=1 Tax=Cupriavidus malaysiensis TaxID=367825 RepID=A0ABM6FGR5_9BURK|nr:type II toxin-antitoxin system RelE/ParE family toxin [Cupriavidus malaysiensis]AOZ11074.1 addiction module toxin RelE [Cupriavidus malaysiensis]
MSYSLQFNVAALKEWGKLDRPIREQFKKKLAERLEHPHVAASRLHGMTDCYKIKLQAAGYRLVYQVHDEHVVVVVIAVGKRDAGRVYAIALDRL